MRRRRAFVLAKTARAVILVALAGLCLLIAVLFLSRWRGRPRVAVEGRDIPPRKVERQDKVRHFVYKGDKGRVELKADKNYVGADGLFHLEGDVDVVQYGQKERPPVRILGDEAVYDERLTKIRFRGNVVVRYEESEIRTPQLEYAKEGEILKTDKGVSFATPRGTGTARRMTYWFTQDRFLFRDRVAFDAKPGTAADSALHMEGDAFEYIRGSRHGILRDNVSLWTGRSRATAGRLVFDLTPGEAGFRNLTLEENVQAAFVRPGGEGERTLQANRALIKPFPGTDSIRMMEAKGSCHAVLPLVSGVPAEIKAPELKAFFDAEGGLKSMTAKGRVEVLERATGTSGERTISGDTLSVNGAKQLMTVEPDKAKKGRSRMVTAQAELEAGTISFSYGKGDVDADGDVKAILQPGAGGKVPGGLFAGRDAVLVSAGQMRYSKDAGRSLYKGDARLWQGKQVIQADLVQVLEAKGSLEGRGKVKTQFWHKPKDAVEEERVEIDGETIEFRPEERRVSFRKDCRLKARNAVLEADTIAMDLAEGTSEMTRIVARGAVRIQQGSWEGRGGRAEFAVPEETVVLLDKPVLVDKDKGETRGDKLTFQLADGKILIENKKRDRSVTVIKS
ncbi:MAG: LPS export ABC transporter periplasmic protein LptC [Candidatus Aminicenantes bacterium]|nr:LPS export ABC transporter periplasmic protein LptC [Candidatus Aminicenantes bacterium]